MEPLEKRRSRPAETNTQEPLRESASQTAGPYVHIGALPNMAGIEGVYSSDLRDNGEISATRPITISGFVYEGNQEPGKDIMLEFWQPDENGSFQNGIWRRTGTNFEDGSYSVDTVMPGSYEDNSGVLLAPFISVWVVARGINIGLQTRIYFPENEELNVNDPHLALVDEARRSTLIAQSTEISSNYTFDVHLQGDNETVFFQT